MVKRKAADTTELWGRLERLVLEWRTLDPKSEAARRSLNFEMTEVILSLVSESRCYGNNGDVLDHGFGQI